MLTFFFIALFFQIGAWAAFSAESVKQDLKKANVIPDVFGEFEPASELRITYRKIKQLRMGMPVTAEETEKAPHVWFSKTSNELQYTLMLVDPDAGQESPYLHWIVTNIDNQKPAADVDDPDHQYVSYAPPTPPPDSGPHRYVFSVFEQPHLNQTFTPDVQTNRHQFDIDAFTKDNGLNLVGALYMTQESV